MDRFSTNQAAKKLGVHVDTLAHYIAVGKVPSPEVIAVGKGKRVVHAWTEAEIEHVRQLLPKIANGRKTRYKKKHSALSSQQKQNRGNRKRSKTTTRRAAPGAENTERALTKSPYRRQYGYN